MAISLQSLPWNILSQVLQKLIDGNQVLYNDGASGLEQKANNFAPLLYTCRSWRYMALQRFCSHVHLTIECNQHAHLRSTLCNWPSVIRYPASKYNHLVQDIVLDVDFKSILNGRASQILTNDKNLVFPAAKILRVCFVHMDLEFYDLDKDLSSLSLQFVKDLKSKIPRLRNITVDYGSNYEIGNEKYFKPFDNLLNYFFRSSESPTLHCDSLAANVSYIAPPLTHLKLVWNIFYLHTIQLIHNNASTLNELSLTFEHLDEIELLVQNKKGALITYSNLRKIRFSCWFYLNYAEAAPTTKALAPFPNLEEIYMYMDYPFKDDTLFRGTSYSLKYVSLNANSNFIDIALKYKIFGNGKYPHVQNVRVKNIDNSLVRSGAPSNDIINFALSISAQPQTLNIDDITMDNSIVPLVLQSNNLHQLQVLDISLAPLTLQDMVFLLQHLPLLTDLHSQISGLGFPNNVNTDQHLVDHFNQNYKLLNKNFKVWWLDHGEGKDVDLIAKCAMLLAISCPQFTSVSVKTHLPKTYKQ
ncbi:hypothetical protein BX667DRAFT_507140 [Coemansia mojavensis]|nr:hypothetical protein BX667DRAFT_507140 [Coemansia mojavensis]